MRGPCVEQSGRCMCEVLFGHQVVCLEDALYIRTVDADSDAHDHVLGSFGHAVVDTEEV